MSTTDVTTPTSQKSPAESKSTLIVPHWAVPTLVKQFSHRFVNLKGSVLVEGKVGLISYEVPRDSLKYAYESMTGEYTLYHDSIVKLLMGSSVPFVWQHGDMHTPRYICFCHLFSVAEGVMRPMTVLMRGAHLNKLEGLMKAKGFEGLSSDNVKNSHWSALIRIYFEQCYDDLEAPNHPAQDLMVKMFEPDHELYVPHSRRIFDDLMRIGDFEFAEDVFAELWAVNESVPPRLVYALQEMNGDSAAVDIASEMIAYALDQDMPAQKAIQMIDDAYQMLYDMDLDPKEELDPASIFQIISGPQGEVLKYLIERPDFVEDTSSLAPVLISIIHSLYDEGSDNTELLNALMEHANALMQHRAASVA